MPQINDDMHGYFDVVQSVSVGVDGSLTQRSQVSKAVEEGRYVLCNAYNPTVPAAGTLVLLIETGPSTGALVKLTLTAQAQGATIRIYEGADVADSVFTPCINLNRQLAPLNIPDITVTKDPATINSLGVNIWVNQVVGITGAGATDFIDKEIDLPLVLLPNTQYLFEVTNDDTQARPFALTVDHISGGS